MIQTDEHTFPSPPRSFVPAKQGCRVRFRQLADLRQTPADSACAHADKLVKLAARLFQTLLCRFKHVAEAVEFRFDCAEHLPDLGRPLLDRQRFKAHLQAVKQRGHSRRSRDNHLVVSLELFDQVKDVLAVMGSSVVYCGTIGAGNTTKLANQIIVAANIAACAEAFILAKKAGVDPAVVFEAIKGGLAGSTVMNAKVPMMLERDFNPGFKIDLHIKDLNNAIDTGHGVGSPLPLTAQVMEMMQWLRKEKCGQDDHSALAKYYEYLAGVKIVPNE